MNYRKISLFVFVLLFAFAPHTQAQTCQPVSVGLVAWWSADGNALDSRSRNNGTLRNGAGFAAGQIGQAFLFDGAEDSVDSSSSPNPVLNFGTGNFTIEAWVKTSSSGTVRTIYGNGNNINPLVLMRIEADNRARLLIRDNAGVVLDVLGTTTNLNNGAWHHIAGVREGTTARLYVDGAQQNSVSNGAFNEINSICNFAYIGGFRSDSVCTAPANESLFNGSIDEVSVYNRALSATEIQAIFNAGTAGKCKPTATVAPSGQVAWLAGDGNANDIAGTNNGTIQGNVTHTIGKVSQGFQIGGTGDASGNGDRINVGNPVNLQLQDLTIEAWIKRSSSTIVTNSPFPGLPNGIFFAYGQNGYGFLIDGATNKLAATQVGVSGIFSNLTISDTNWHHVAFTKSGSQVNFYLDGIADTPQTYNPTFSFTTNAAIGARGDNDVRNSFFGAIDELAIYNRGLTTAEIQSILNAGIAGKLKDNSTPAGANVVVGTKSDGTVTFPNVAAAGTTQQIPLDLSLFPALPMGTAIGLNYDLATSAIFTGNPAVCFNLPASTPTQFANLRILHLESGVWINRTASGNTFPNLCSVALTSLSPFAVAQVAPVAAAVSISGRISTANGNGIRGVNIALTKPNGEIIRTISSSFGYYRFDNLPVGETYILSVSAKRFTFAEPTRVINLNDELTDEDFTAEGK